MTRKFLAPRFPALPVILAGMACSLGGCYVAPYRPPPPPAYGPPPPGYAPAPVAYDDAPVVAYTPPPAPLYEAPPPAPAIGFVWAPGYWDWGGGRYFWHGGGWVRPPHPGARWFAPRWEHRAGGWAFHRGHFG